MEIYILNRDLELKGVLDTFESLIWNRRYYKPGEFELHCYLSNKNLNLLQKGNLIFKDNGEEAGYITTRQLYKNQEGKEVIKVNGKFITNYLEQRINWGRINFTGKTEILMRKLVLENAIDPEHTNRKIENLTLGDLKEFDDEIQYQNSFGNIIKCLENISNTSGIGYRNILDVEKRKIIFELYKGIDRTINNGSIAPCIFSRDFENILEQEYIESISNYKNTALIAGAGEGEERRLTFIEQGQGLDRYELYVDARDLSDEKEEDEKMPDNEYLPILLQRGNEKLEEHKKISTFDSKINTKGNNTYKENYDIGDIVTIVDEEWNLRIDTRITQIDEVYEQQGFNVYVTFGNNIPTLIDKIKQVVM